MNLKKLSEALKIERGSLSFKFSETIILENNAELFQEITELLNSLRETVWPDRGFSFNFTDAKRINKGGEDFILSVIQYVIDNNSLNMDVWTSQKPSLEIKELIEKIQLKLKEKNNKSIRIRLAKERENLNKFLLFNWIAGLVFILIGSTKMVIDQNIKTQWFEGLNTIQLIGAVMVLISLLPYAFKYIKQLKNKE